jgi:hypothetical protein
MAVIMPSVIPLPDVRVSVDAFKGAIDVVLPDDDLFEAFDGPVFPVRVVAMQAGQ